MALNDIIDAGELNKRITLKKRTKVQNTTGEEIETFTDLATVWAKIEKSPSFTENTEMDQNSLQKERETFLFTIRYISNITRDMKIYYKNRYYDIIDINNVFQTNKKLIIKAEYFY